MTNYSNVAMVIVGGEAPKTLRPCQAGEGQLVGDERTGPVLDGQVGAEHEVTLAEELISIENL
jgi:hypothetical protein